LSLMEYERSSLGLMLNFVDVMDIWGIYDILGVIKVAWGRLIGLLELN
jgi:hypothetical protein